MSFTVHPVTRAIGAEITGCDLSAPLDAETSADLKAALAQHQVVFFRNQDLSIEALRQLTTRFGTLMRLPYVSPMEEHPDVIRVLKEANEGGGVFGGDWHQDFSFLAQPPAGSLLAAVEVPACGGDTLWVSQSAAWEALPAPLQDILRGRDAIHVGKPYGVRWAPPQAEQSGASIKMSRGDPAADQEQHHPAVIRNPATGREALFLNPLYVLRLDGLTEDQSRPILSAVQAHTTRPEFQCRWRWQVGDVAIWDNLFTQHYALNDYFGFRREMWRTTFAGAAPRSLAV
ncbi:MAG: TauD/TfdA family dioxygenase [Rhodobacterales bacterium]|jgi:taurine dioxygenase|nr:TauD/TfdA family dioxygenase [Pseudomonadota bacterium]MDA1287203.1 TauD/TfdA family dioxygenase [Pseudomonadota bacterium]NQW13150.1 TauD/TfdA family dioxygenase [Rhodobacter sp.]